MEDLSKKITRRDLLKLTPITAASLVLSGGTPARVTEPETPKPALDVIQIQDNGRCRYFNSLTGELDDIPGPCDIYEKDLETSYTPPVTIFVGSRSDLEHTWYSAFGPRQTLPMKDQEKLAKLTHQGYTAEDLFEVNEFLDEIKSGVRCYPGEIPIPIVDAAMAGKPRAREAVRQLMGEE
jgi:hypothetical protein